jgi:hypothetical protein
VLVFAPSQNDVSFAVIGRKWIGDADRAAITVNGRRLGGVAEPVPCGPEEELGEADELGVEEELGVAEEELCGRATARPRRGRAARSFIAVIEVEIE